MIIKKKCQGKGKVKWEYLDDEREPTLWEQGTHFCILNLISGSIHLSIFVFPSKSNKLLTNREMISYVWKKT